MMKKQVAFFLAVILLMTNVPAIAAQSQTFVDVPQKHWASASIAKAVETGYVSGFPDGTFKPDQVVTREEFIKMAVEAFGLDTSRYSAASVWSFPYLAAAAENGWIAPDEYDKRKDKLIPPEGYMNRGVRMATIQKKDGDLLTVYADTAHYPMPRHEMAKVAINALGKSVEKNGKDWEYKNAVMKQAVNLGIIQSVGNGNLDPDGTSTRAQAVVVIERMLTAKNGGTLPVSEDAKDSASKERDPWGRVIRTTNLPKNASDFPYILEGIPNEMYEMPFFLSERVDYFKTPKQVFDEGYFTKEGLDVSLARVEKALNMILDVDYKTIDPEVWGKELAENQRGGPLIQDYMNTQYAKWVVENKIQIEGTAKVEPSMVYKNRFGMFVRTKVKFRINNYDKMTNELLYDPYLKLVYENNEKYRLKKGIWYEGYADIEFSTVTLGENVSDTYGLFVEASLFRWSTFNGVNYGF